MKEKLDMHNKAWKNEDLDDEEDNQDGKNSKNTKNNKNKCYNMDRYEFCSTKEKAVLRARPFLMDGNEFCSILALQQQRQDSDHNLKKHSQNSPPMHSVDNCQFASSVIPAFQPKLVKKYCHYIIKSDTIQAYSLDILLF